MIDSIKKFFNEKIETSDQQAQISSEHAVSIATCALLLEMAHADSEFSESEKERIIGILKSVYHITSQEAKELISLSEHERNESTDLWQFTNLINQKYSHDEKVKVAETLWHVIYTDGKVDQHEEYLMRKLTYLLDLDHEEMIEAKFKARDSME